MNETEKIDIVKNLIKETLSKLTISGKVEINETVDGPMFVVKTPEGGLLIGENGKNLISFNHIIKKIAGKKIACENKEEYFQFTLDINDYQAKKISELRNMVRVNAQRVRYFKKEIALKPMTSFERMIVHSTLVDCPDITTHSEGKEPQRYVTIKPFIIS